MVEVFLRFQFRIYLKLGVGGFHISGAFSRSHQFRRETKPQPNAPQYSTCTCYKEPRQPNGLWQTSNGVQSFDCSGVQSLNSNVVQSFECNIVVQHCNAMLCNSVGEKNSASSICWTSKCCTEEHTSFLFLEIMVELKIQSCITHIMNLCTSRYRP